MQECMNVIQLGLFNEQFFPVDEVWELFLKRENIPLIPLLFGKDDFNASLYDQISFSSLSKIGIMEMREGILEILREFSLKENFLPTETVEQQKEKFVFQKKRQRRILDMD